MQVYNYTKLLVPLRAICHQRRTKQETYLDDLPSTGQWVLELGLDSGEDDCVSARVDDVFSTNNSLASLGIAVEEEFLGGERD